MFQSAPPHGERQCRKVAKGSAGHEIFRLARNRDILGIILIAENLILIILFFILPLFK